MSAIKKGNWTNQVPSTPGLFYVAHPSEGYGVAEITKVEGKLLAQIWGSQRGYLIPLPITDYGFRHGWKWWSEQLPRPDW